MWHYSGLEFSIQFCYATGISELPSSSEAGVGLGKDLKCVNVPH